VQSSSKKSEWSKWGKEYGEFFFSLHGLELLQTGCGGNRMKHFKFSEFACRCCGVNKCSKEFMEKVDLARDLSGVPWVLNSAYRCKENNEKVGGQKDSAHMEGLAVDVRATDPFIRFRIITGAIQAGFTRIKVYSRWVHIDETKNESKPKVWFGIGVHE